MIVKRNLSDQDVTEVLPGELYGFGLEPLSGPRRMCQIKAMGWRRGPLMLGKGSTDAQVRGQRKRQRRPKKHLLDIQSMQNNDLFGLARVVLGQYFAYFWGPRWPKVRSGINSQHALV